MFGDIRGCHISEGATGMLLNTLWSRRQSPRSYPGGCDLCPYLGQASTGEGSPASIPWWQEGWGWEALVWFQFSSVQLLSRVRFFATPWTAAHQASLSITNSWSLPKLMSIESVIKSFRALALKSLDGLFLISLNFTRSPHVFHWIAPSPGCHLWHLTFYYFTMS